MQIIHTRNKQLIENEQTTLRELLEHTEGLLYQFQYFPDKNSYSFPYASSGLWNIYEVTPEQIRYDAKPALDRIHKDDIHQIYKIMQESMIHMESCSYDYRVILPSKGLRWLRGQAKPLKLEDGSYLWNGCIIDITVQKKMEIDLFEHKQRLQFAIEGSQEGVWDWNLKSKKVSYSNKSLEILGFEPHEFENTAEAWDNRVHIDDRKSYFEDIETHFNGVTEYYINEHRVQCKDGSYKWVLDRGKVIERDQSNKVVRVIGTHTDITQKKQREEELKKKNDIIEQQNKRLLNFAHITSHNLRSHTGNIEMLLEIINTADNQTEKEEAFEHLNNVSKSLSETITHLNQIVSVQTKTSDKLKRINLYSSIENTCLVLKGNIDEKNANIIIDVPVDLFINYNPAYLESILLNLISNAVKYTHVDRNPEIKIKAFHENQKLILEISDNGIGIDMDAYGESLFGMYKTFHGNHDAVGIGLYITKNQVEAMGGQITVESKKNIGTSFKVFFDEKSMLSVTSKVHF